MAVVKVEGLVVMQALILILARSSLSTSAPAEAAPSRTASNKSAVFPFSLGLPRIPRTFFGMPITLLACQDRHLAISNVSRPPQD